MRKLNWLLPAAVVLVVTAGAVIYQQYFRDRWQPPTVVVVESKQAVFTLFPSYMSWAPNPEEGGKRALLLRDGDHFMSAPHDVPLRYLASDGPTLQMASGSGRDVLNGNVVSLSIPDDEAMTWLAGATDEQLAKIRTISVSDDVSPEQLTALKRLATVNPHLDLNVESVDVLNSLLAHFQPRAVFCGQVAGNQLAILAGQPELETLLIYASEPGSFDYLPKLPKLRRLVLGSPEAERSGPLPAGLDGLKSLIIVGSESGDASAPQAAPIGLEELSFNWMDDFPKLDAIEEMTGLRVLILGAGSKDAEPRMPDLSTLQKLRWLGLPPGLTQQQLAAVVKSQPNLEILELLETEKPLDLAPLRELKNLHGLVLGGTYENLDVVQSLTSLRFLGISDDSWPESHEKIAEIRAALPDAIVIRIEPACLGSGWLLLLLPLLGTAWLRHERRYRPARAA